MLLVALCCQAQQKTSNSIKDAIWIKMIDDPNVNYYEAIKAYDDYWLTHKKPAEIEDNLAEKEKQGPAPQTATPTREEKIYEDQMRYQVKRFENWLREEKPFVQENGHILTPQERIEIWKTQQGQKEK